MHFVHYINIKKFGGHNFRFYRRFNLSQGRCVQGPKLAFQRNEELPNHLLVSSFSWEAFFQEHMG